MKAPRTAHPISSPGHPERMSGSRIEEQAVLVTAFGKPSRDGVARVRIWPPRARTLRVAKGLGACWGLALPALFIPVVHFFLVPGFLIGGAVLALRWSGQSRTYDQAVGLCPSCEQEVGFRVRGEFKLPRETSCRGCGARVILKAPGGAGGPA